MFCFSTNLVFIYIYAIKIAYCDLCNQCTQIYSNSYMAFIYFIFFYEELYFATAVVECGNYELCLIIFNNDKLLVNVKQDHNQYFSL